jgi:hypothetical protein
VHWDGLIAAAGGQIYVYIPWGIKEISVYRNLVLTMNSRCVDASKTPLSDGRLVNEL